MLLRMVSAEAGGRVRQTFTPLELLAVRVAVRQEIGRDYWREPQPRATFGSAIDSEAR
jgi:hypothetical protein